MAASDNGSDALENSMPKAVMNNPRWLLIRPRARHVGRRDSERLYLCRSEMATYVAFQLKPHCTDQSATTSSTRWIDVTTLDSSELGISDGQP